SKVDILIITALDEIAWTFNIRGSDVEYCPVSIAFAVISSSCAHLFIDEEKIDQELLKKLGNDNISLRRYSEFYDQIKNYPKEYVIQLAPAKTNYKITSSIEDKYEIKKDNHLISGMKAKKNDVEISNLKVILDKDCIALTRFLIWLKTNINNLTINEFEAAEKLLEFRRENPEFVEASFESISAYDKNAAMMHYSANKTGSTNLKDKGFYLIDSGGQYKSGTTDITRTITLGQVSDKQCRDFTLVLKGVIDLSNARFLKGTTGANLDILARIHLWKAGIDYKCGSGHGVGSFLNVHEGPQNFSQVLINNPFEPGMVTTIEPGVYLENRYGIRTENMLLTVEDGTTNHGKWLKFETISFCPIDREAIVVDMLSDEQLKWINNYHQQVYAKISQRLNAEENKVLKIMTAELVR
ncbi:MAG: aminopeptidase P family protein, partial [Candidatus Cloacimonetes bacterium]|nr:aminopeptidase P family protein [Candidatus Cloacimonadota bacterium]